MKMKINKACDLNSISVLPPHSRRSSLLPTGGESSIFGKSQASAPQQLRSQPSQQSFSQGASSQQGIFSQLSQNSLEDVLTNDQRLVSQDIESSAKRVHCLPPVNHSRDESQMQITRSTGNLMRKWSAPEYKCQVSEELQHRIGMMETSLSRVAMILDSVQKDIMQVNRGTKEVTFEIESIRQKITGHDDLLQLTHKGQEDVKANLEGILKSLTDQMKQNLLQETTREISMILSALPEKVETRMMKSHNDLAMTLSKELQAISCSLKDSLFQKITTPTIHQLKANNHHVPNQEMKSSKSGPQASLVNAATLPPKVEMGTWNSVKTKQATPKERSFDKKPNQKAFSPVHKERKRRVTPESDEDIDGGFSCLFSGKEKGEYTVEVEDERRETERILRKARRRKRKSCNPIIID